MDLSGLSTRSTWAQPVVVVLCALVVSVGFALHAEAQGKVTLHAIEDAYVESANPDTTHGNSGDLYVAFDEQSSATSVALIKFDLSAIPANATVTSATPRLNMDLANEMVEVSAGHIVELAGPESFWPGRSVDFSVTYANTSSAQQSVLFKLAVLDLAGRLEDDLGDVTRTVSANGRSTVTYSWDGRTVPLGQYQLVATVIPDGGTPRKAVEIIEVESRTRGPVRHPTGRVSP